MAGAEQDPGTPLNDLAARFEEHRPYLRRLAYSTLGTISEADDVVQETWLRLQRTDPGQIANLRAWLTTVAGRIALDMLGSARARREQYVGSWLPEPEVSEWDPADRVTQDERVTMALLVVLESLSPAERTAFVLHDVFGLSSQEVADVVGRTPAAVRQLAVRARRHVEDGSPRFPASADDHARIVGAFAAAWQGGDLDGLVQVLDKNVVFTSDGGGKVSAVPRPLTGAEQVARVLVAMARTAKRRAERARGELVLVNGRPGFVVFDGTTLGVLSFTVDGGRIVAIDAIRNPDKLTQVRMPESGLFDTN